jgi:poly(A) polymerase
MLKRIRELFGHRGRKSGPESRADGDAGRDEGPSHPPVRRGPKVVHWPIPEADLDSDAVKIVRRLTRFDHRAYLVGGCVRDLLLERKPKDFDVGTSATPRQIKRLFRNCRIIGRRFRLAHVYFQNGKIIEVATFRALDGHDTETGDGSERDLLIRDDNVFGTPEEDALRRDFTINALFYNVGERTVLDHTDGLGDLRRKLIRTIGDPEIRFREDPIRILRAIKFAARLGFSIEERTLGALRDVRGDLDKAATARVLEEINRFCRSGAARHSFELLLATEVFDVIFPEIARPYARRADARELMLDLLAQMDRERAGSKREIRSGEIFAVLLLPLLAPELGWQPDGTVNRPRGLSVRQAVDAKLRPLALRLRIPRREQEHCRQILATLARMVPARHVRRSTKRAIARRECLPDAMWVLKTLADRFAEDFAAAHVYWSTVPPEPPQPRRSEPTRARSRRGGRERSRRKGTKTARSRDERPAGRRERAPRKDKTGRTWDDDYFFSALPSAPEVEADASRGDRYGAAAVAPESRDAKGPSSDREAAAGSKRKRRRRRRRKPGSAKKERSGGTAGSKGSDNPRGTGSSTASD